MVFKKIIFEAVGNLYKNKVVLARALLIPFLLIIALEAIEEFEPDKLISLIFMILGFGVQAMFAIITHRVVLLGPKAVTKWGLYRWTLREIKFLLYIIASFLIVAPFAIATLFFPILGTPTSVIIFSIVWFWIMSRLSLVFPALAIDQITSIKISWGHTKKHQILMILVICFFPLVFSLLSLPLYIVSLSLFENFWGYFTDRFSEISLRLGVTLFFSFTSIFLIIFEIAALSIAYKYICKEANVGEPITSGEA